MSRLGRLGDGAAGLALDGLAPPLAALLILAGIGTAPAIAAPASPHWSIVSESQPTYFKAGDSADAYVLIVRNDGGAPTTPGSTVTVTDTLPSVAVSDGAPGVVTATKITVHGEGSNGHGSPRYELTCPHGPVTGTVTCSYKEGPLEEGAEQGRVLPGATIALTITVSIPAGVQALSANSATVSGGGAPSASTSETTPIDPAPVPFGLSLFDLDTVGEGGEADTQAGSHPFELTAELAFNIGSRESAGGESPLADAAPKDLEVALPPGLIGDPDAVPRCSQRAFLEGEALGCPLDTQLGTIKPYFYGSFPSAVYPLFDVVPPPGEPGELGFSVAGIGHVPIFLQVRVDSDGEYGLTASLRNIPETGPFQGAILTLWGVPAAASHDLEREGRRGEASREEGEPCKPAVRVEGGVETREGCPSGAPATALLTLPGQCREDPLAVGVLSDSWQAPGPPLQPLRPEPDAIGAITGCERLSFDPSLALAPETVQAGAPGGYTLALHVPQSEDPSALATPPLRRAVVSLPAGAVLSPSFANGLQGCSQQQFGLRPFGTSSLLPAACPPRSQIGTVRITTPLLADPLEGAIFLGDPDCAPCGPADAQEGRLIRLLLQAQGSGATIKLEGSASIDQATGQLTASFQESPQLPFEDLELTLDGGASAPLVNPSTCGIELAASAQLTPYSSEAPAEPSSEPFEVRGCPTPRFHPSFVAGTTDNEAGAFSAASVTLSRTGEDEELQALTVHLPPGLLAMLSEVELCPQAQARAGACGPQSQIGTVTVRAGPGADPLSLGGSVYLTGPREGAPFGLSIVLAAIVGPFDLGTIDVAARIDVNPSSAALTVTSDALPQRLDGIPLQLKTVDLDIDRERFIFNPTDCRALAIEGALDSNQGATALVSSRFQAANCATLAFRPRLTARTGGETSRAGGVHLHVRVVSGPGQANIAKVEVELPEHMVARLSTLQQACVAAVFAANPADCPAGSVVGTAGVFTPMLSYPLVGPAYLVSLGSLATPEIVIVLQGGGVVMRVVGHTSIAHGLVSSAFPSLPDAPISRFDLVLDAGPHSLLAANLPAQAHGSICGRSLVMLTRITGQNGAVLTRRARVSVSGCPRHAAHARHEVRARPTARPRRPPGVLG